MQSPQKSTKENKHVCVFFIRREGLLLGGPWMESERSVDVLEFAEVEVKLLQCFVGEDQ